MVFLNTPNFFFSSELSTTDYKCFFYLAKGDGLCPATKFCNFAIAARSLFLIFIVKTSQSLYKLYNIIRMKIRVFI